MPQLENIEAIEKRLWSAADTRTNYQQHYEQIIEEYNREKDRATIEKTFEALFVFMQGLDQEEDRAIREGLDQESLAIFDLLKKPDLGKADIKRIKQVSVELLATLKAEKLKIERWREKEATRDAVRLTIHDFLWSDSTGLPVEVYEETDVAEKAAEVFRHVFRAYSQLPSPLYPGSEAA